MPGISSFGFEKKTFDEIRTEVIAAIQAEIPTTLNFQADSVLSSLIDPIIDQLRDKWDAMEEVYNSQYLDTASDASLDLIVALADIQRVAGTNSTATLELNIGAGVTVPAGRVVSQDSNGVRWVTALDAVNLGSFRDLISVAAIAEDVGPFFAAAGSIDSIETPVTGWFSNALVKNGAPQTFPLVNGDTLLLRFDSGTTQTVTFLTADFVTIGLATAAEVAAVIDDAITGGTSFVVAAGTRFGIQSDTSGPASSVQIVSGTSLTALSLVAGTYQGFNPLDGVVGAYAESDSQLRIRYVNAIRGLGSSTVDAIRSSVLGVTGVTQCLVFENSNLITVNGVPGKAFEAVVEGGADADIRDAIFANKPAGIQAFGAVSGSVVDSQGFNQEIDFSRPVDVDMYIIIDVTYKAGVYGSGSQTLGDDAVKEALVTIGDEQDIGQIVKVILFQCAVLDNVDGVEDITAFAVEDMASPTNTANFPVASREIAKFDTSRITVNSVAV